jgi:hypothetical protein
VGHRLWIILVSAAPLAAAACTALTGANGLTVCSGEACSGATDADPGDADLADSGLETASMTDTAFVDTTGPGDGGSGEAGPWCVVHGTGHTFCADFDEPSLDAGWTTVTAVSATLTQDGTTWSSPPFSLDSKTDGTAGSAATQEGRFTKSLPTITTLNVAFAVRLDTVDSSCHAVRLDFGDYSLLLDLGMQGLIEQGPVVDAGPDAGGYSTEYPLASLPALHTWSQATIAVQLAPVRHVSIVFDSVMVLSTGVFSTFTNGSLAVGVGVHTYTKGLCEAHYDNVLIDVE